MMTHSTAMLALGLSITCMVAFVGAYESSAEWVPGMKEHRRTVPPLPPRDPDAEVIGPTIDPRPIIDGNFPVDQNHEFASFFVNDKPRLPEQYDRELAAQGLTPEQRQHGENVIFSQRAVRPPPLYPSRLTSHQGGGAQLRRPVAGQKRRYLRGRRPALSDPRSQPRVPRQGEAPPRRPPLPVSYLRPAVPTKESRLGRASGSIQLKNGYNVQLVPIADQTSQTDQRANPVTYPAHQQNPAPSHSYSQSADNRKREQYQNRPSTLQADLRPQLPSEQQGQQQQHQDSEFGHESLPQWPDLADPASLERYHEQMRERMDRIMQNQMQGAGPSTPVKRGDPLPLPATSNRILPSSSARQHRDQGVLVEHHQRSSDAPFVRESYKVYKLPNGRRTTYSRQTSTNFTTRRRLGYRRRAAAGVPLKRSLRSALGDAAEWLDGVLTSAEKRGREATASAGEAVGDLLTAAHDTTARVGGTLGEAASDVIQRGRETAAAVGEVIAQIPDGASRAGSAIYRTAEQTYQNAANSPAGQALSDHADRVLSEVDLSSVSDSFNQAAQAVSELASDALDRSSDVRSTAEDTLSAFGEVAGDAASDIGDRLPQAV